MDDAIRCSVKLNNSRCEGTYYRSSADDSSELLCVNGIYSSLCSSSAMLQKRSKHSSLLTELYRCDQIILVSV